jgi:hypothetical protein
MKSLSCKGTIFFVNCLVRPVVVDLPSRTNLIILTETQYLQTNPLFSCDITSPSRTSRISALVETSAGGANDSMTIHDIICCTSASSCCSWASGDNAVEVSVPPPIAVVVRQNISRLYASSVSDCERAPYHEVKEP